MTESSRPYSTPNICVAAVIGWLIPGGGHWFLGLRGRGTAMFIAVLSTYLIGLILGSIYVIGPKVSIFACVCQLFSGLPGIISSLMRNPNMPEFYGRCVDLGLVYTGIAGGLNLLCILDIIGRHPLVHGPAVQEE